MLQTVIDELEGSVIKNAFRRSGICPFNVDNVDFNRILKTTSTSSNISAANHTPDNRQNEIKIALEVMELSLLPHQVSSFKNNAEDEWRGLLEDKSLYMLWRKLNAKLEGVVFGGDTNCETIETQDLIDHNLGHAYCYGNIFRFCLLLC